MTDRLKSKKVESSNTSTLNKNAKRLAALIEKRVDQNARIEAIIQLTENNYLSPRVLEFLHRLRQRNSWFLELTKGIKSKV